MRLGLDPLRTYPVPGSERFVAVYALGSSERQEKLLISGTLRTGERTSCGLFELDTNNGRVNPLQTDLACRPDEAYTSISLAPDAQNAVAVHNHSLVLIGLANGSIRKLRDDIDKAAWSPDGKMVATLQHVGPVGTVLLDAPVLGTLMVA
jgi:hypothetical protein